MAVKNRIEDLALFGGPPAFAEPLHVGRPNIGDRERFLRRVRRILDSGRLTNDGPMVHEFEEALACFLRVKHCVATCNGTVAIQIAARAAEISGEVILPAFTFVATAHALDWIGIKPVFCDVDADSLTLDPRRVEELVTSRTGAILGVHLWGRSCRVVELEEIGQRRNVRVLFDAAQALGCTAGGTRLGCFGDAEVFSFHSTKICNSFEGGAIATDDDILAARARRLRNFGFDGRGDVAGPGTNGKMSEIAAAMGLTSLESWDEFASKNRVNTDWYRRELAGVPGLRLLSGPQNEESNYHSVVVEVREDCPIDRDNLRRVLHAERILARRYFWPGCHKREPYRSREPDLESRLPITEAVARRVLSFPTGTAVGPEDIRLIADVVRFAVSRGHEILETRTLTEKDRNTG